MAGRTIDTAHESDSDIDPADPAVAVAAAAKAKGRGKGKGKRKGKFQNIVDPTKEAEYQQQNRRSQRRMREWLANIHSLWDLMVFVCIGHVVMICHYSLFKSGARLNASEDKSTALWSYLAGGDSRAAQALSHLSVSLDITSPSHALVWGFVLSWFGPMAEWPGGFVESASVCRLQMMGGLWRRLVFRCLS